MAMDTDGIPQDIGDYRLKSELGRGSFAVVWLAEHRILKTEVAIKVVARSSIGNEDLQTRFVRELNILKQMDHPFIAKLYEIITTSTHTYVVQELAERGSLLNLVNSHGRLPEAHARRYFAQLLSALEYLHDERMIAHRDLKAENVLLDRNLNIRLIDFGLSQTFSRDTPQLLTACGSPAYASPEMIQGLPYTKSADVWSAGILLYAITAGQLPFEDDVVQRILQKIAFTEPIYPSFLSPQLIDLLKKILCKGPEDRITISKIKWHPWFSQSPYLQMLANPLSQDEDFSMKGVERELVDYIARLGVDVRLLPAQIIEGEYNETTALYVILRREMITDRLRELMQRLTAPRIQGPGIPKVLSANGVVLTSPKAPGAPRAAVRAKIPVPQSRRHTGGVSPRVAIPPIQPITPSPFPPRPNTAEELDPLPTAETLMESPRQLHKAVLPLKRARSHSLK